MNYLIIINRAINYLPFYHELAKKLKAKGNNVYLAIDSHLTPLLYNVDGKIELEAFYFSEFFKDNYDNAVLNPAYTNDNIWGAYFSDFERFTYYNLNKDKPKEYFKKLNICLINFFDEIVKNKKIDRVIYENVSNSLSFAAYLVAAKYETKYVGLSIPRLPNRFEITGELYGNGEKVKRDYFLLANGDIDKSAENYQRAKDYLDNFFNVQPDYMRNNVLTPSFNLFSKYFNFDKLHIIRQSVRYLFKYSADVKYCYQGTPLKINWESFKRTVKRKVKIPLVSKMYDKIDLNDEFYIYPIHYHPEASTSVNAPAYINDYENVLKIAFNLPFGTFLYVKEHISNVGYPDLNFYRKIKNIPNVKLIQHDANTKELIKKSKGIISVTSTMGYEAIILNKKVYLLGNVFYDFHPLCTKIKSFDDLFGTLIKDRGVEDTYDPLPFILAYYNNTYDGSLKYLKEPDMTLFKDDYIIKVIENDSY